MTIFSLELNKDFKISNTKGQRIYFHEKNFLDLCKNNSLKISKDNLSNYNLENNLINHLPSHRYSKEELCSYIETKYHLLNNLKEEKTLYPEWLLFYIAVQKYSFSYTSKNEFEKYISFFEIISEIRHKNYIKNNPKNFINTFDNYDELLEALKGSFDKLIRLLAKELDEEKLFNFLAFLWKFHRELKDVEKYKLMWNLETYIIECINLLTDKDIDFKYVYKHHKALVCGKRQDQPSPLHEIQINIPLYIEEHQHYFTKLSYKNDPTLLEKINHCLSQNITAYKLLEVFASNDKIQNLVFSRLEIDRFYNSNKFNEFVMKSLIKNFILEIESLIIDNIPKPLQERDNLFNRLKNIKAENILTEYRNLIKQNANWSEFSAGIKAIEKENDSIEKYLMIYYHFRNYFAHNHVNVDELIWSENGEYIRTILESAIITIYFVATFKK
ncbi:hypothetical protein IB633_08235 [Francisella philomiragia]|uniref:Uncharacterized protein n=1 Tax=Francisella philomiragia subsp. philomiragia (strain ATCC 25017 / CCUG 19701 / FSC 153 / O\|nr:hypothetical protein [Francisella philomiragia]AJI47643.1 hypothetical protein BF30_508 [Francisella philomiragia]AJI49424.1 hypothetical protein KU46_1046 [Francisella philomiragia]MBK2021069.1 hypothetical protein [Francisella philomiragia]MBK2031050.1 hypothetical protein [Francisella philomiragia]MBK2264181.1 hypothetical protein [Francisella philomiragia]